MKTIALLLVIAAVAAQALDWNDLVATWRVILLDPLRKKSFYEIPRTQDDAVSAGWVQADVEQSCNVSTWCLADDPRFCIMLDSYGYIAGVQIGILVSDAEHMQSIYSMARIKYFQKKTIFNQETWTSAAYTQDPDAINSGGTSATWSELTGTEGVWFDSTEGFVEISRNLADLDSMWTKEGCVPTMGQHYYYNLVNSTACEDVVPWFLLYDGEDLMGVGFRTFGTASIKDRSWYDETPDGGYKSAIPYAPQCLYDWSAEYGVIATHVWFKSHPYTFIC